jgi:hypothetical protein
MEEDESSDMSFYVKEEGTNEVIKKKVKKTETVVLPKVKMLEIVNKV